MTASNAVILYKDPICTMRKLWFNLIMRHYDLHVRRTRVPGRIRSRNPHGVRTPAALSRPLGPQLQGDHAALLVDHRLGPIRKSVPVTQHQPRQSRSRVPSTRNRDRAGNPGREPKPSSFSPARVVGRALTSYPCLPQQGTQQSRQAFRRPKIMV